MAATATSVASATTQREQMRARYPDDEGFIERDGVRVFWERYGDGAPTILLMPTWSLFHSRHWKMQIPYLARHFRVVTFDGRGNGRSDRPPGAAAYADTEFVADAIAVLDATGTEHAVIAGLSMGGGYALRLAAEHSDRVIGAIFIGAAVPILDRPPDQPDLQVDPDFDQLRPDNVDWGKYNADYWRRDFPGFAAWFVGEKIFSEPHSTKPTEDGIGWTLETDPETLIATEYGSYLWPPENWGPRDPTQGRALPFARRVRCPSLVIHGDDDRIISIGVAERLAAELDAPLVVVAGGGHSPLGRWPVLVNRLMREFARGVAGDPR